MRKKQRAKGASIIELMIVMTMMGIASAILLALYVQSRSYLSRGTVLTELEQKARIAGGRIIPKIASACVRPAIDFSDPPDGLMDRTDLGLDKWEPAVAILFPPSPDNPDGGYNPPIPANLDPPREVVLFSTKSYVRDLLREPGGDDFDPRNNPPPPALPDPAFGMRPYRIFFVFRNSVDIEKYPDGIVGDVYVDGNTSSNDSDDVLLVSGLRDVRFDRETNNVIRLTISVKAYDPFGSSAGGTAVLKRQHVTKIYLPIWTHSPGG